MRSVYTRGGTGQPTSTLSSPLEGIAQYRPQAFIRCKEVSLIRRSGRRWYRSRESRCVVAGANVIAPSCAFLFKRRPLNGSSTRLPHHISIPCNIQPPLFHFSLLFPSRQSILMDVLDRFSLFFHHATCSATNIWWLLPKWLRHENAFFPRHLTPSSHAIYFQRI